MEASVSQQPAEHLPFRAGRRKPSLAEQLATFRTAMLARMAPGDAAALQASEQAMARSGDTLPQVGGPAPDFTLPDQHGRPVRLADRLAFGPVVVVFTRGGWCPFCTMLLRAWAGALPALHDAGGDLLAVSPQPVPACGGVAERDLLPYPVLSDRDGAAASAYGVDWQVPDAAKPLYARFGYDMQAAGRDGRWRAPFPSVFVIGGDGRIALVHADHIPGHRLDPAAAISSVRALSRPLEAGAQAVG